MSNEVKNHSEDRPDQEPDGDLKLNLTFASTKDLIGELMSRCNHAVVAYQLTDAQMEAEPKEHNRGKDGGGKWTATSYTGSIPGCIGLAEVMKRDLLDEW